jgi:hypothetical protein
MATKNTKSHKTFPCVPLSVDKTHSAKPPAPKVDAASPPRFVAFARVDAASSPRFLDRICRIPSTKAILSIL